MRRVVFVILVMFAGGVPAQAAAPKAAGYSTFKENCILCHGEDGTGKTPPGMALGAHDLTSREVRKRTDAELMQTITRGQNKMPSFANKLDAVQIHELILYIRTLGKKD